MERREAPGRCATAPIRGAGALRRTPQRALQGRDCETRPEARAGGDLKACEASPPNRCASRRSTADHVVGAAPPALPQDASGRQPERNRVRWRLTDTAILVKE